MLSPTDRRPWSWASSGVIRSSCILLRTQSTHLPLGLFPGTIMSTTALTSLFSSILCMCSLTSLTFTLFTPIAPFLCPHSNYFVSQCYTFNSSQHPHLCFLENLFLLFSNCLTFCSIQKYWSKDIHVELDL